MNPTRILGRGAFVVLLTLSGACQSTGAGAGDLSTLPYHVALIPADPGVFEDETPTLSGEQTKDLLQIPLREFAFGREGEGGVEIGEILRSTLEDQLFTKVTLLEAPDGAEGAPPGWWVARAKLAGADLLLEVDQVTYDSRPATKGRPWNYIWFLTGPLVYSFNDRDYRIQGTIEASLYDLQGVGDIEDPAAADLSQHVLGPDQLMRRFRAKPDWVATKFGDRVEGTSGYLLSILLPTSQLQNDGEKLQRKVAAKSLESMSLALAEEIAVDAEFISRPSGGQTFYLDEKVDLTVGAAGDELVLETTLWQKEFSAPEGFERAQLRIGDHAMVPLLGSDGGINVELTDLESERGGWVKKGLVVRLPIGLSAAQPTSSATPLVATTVQLLLQESFGEGQVRSWTLALSDQDHERAVQAVEAMVQRGDAIEAIGASYRIGGGSQ